MQENTTSKEKILKKVRQALIFKQKARFANIDLDSNLYTQPPQEELVIETFAKNLIDLKGQFVFCTNRFDCIDKLITLLEQRKWRHLFCWEEELQFLLKDSGISFVEKSGVIEKVQASITSCEALIARTGSVLVSSKKNSRELTIYPPVHIVIANSSQLVMEIKDGLQILKNRYGKNIPSMVSFISGPSRTSDIEKTLVIGAHGPKELFVFLIDDTKHE
ncbi:MAG: lactate utilization protein [Bacteroidota bacterium]